MEAWCMVDIEEQDLPGIGKKFSIPTLTGGVISVIIHNEGRRDLYVSSDPDEDPFVIILSDEEARKLSSILGDTYFKPTPIVRLKQALTEDINAIKVPSGSSVIEKPIRELDIRKKTGASIVTIIRGEEIIRNPDPDTHLLENDLLMVLGTISSIKKLEKMLQKT
jgi:TrkA domain protein